MQNMQITQGDTISQYVCHFELEVKCMGMAVVGYACDAILDYRICSISKPCVLKW